MLLVTSPIITAISAAAFFVCSESFFISSATTAKPFPRSPACAASTEALSARIFVCIEISVITSAISTICFDCSESLEIITLLSSVPLQISSILAEAADIFLSLSAVISSARLVSSAILLLISERFFRLSEIIFIFSSTDFICSKFASLSRITFSDSSAILRFASVAAAEILSSSVTVSRSLRDTSRDFSRIILCCSAPIRLPSISVVRLQSIVKIADIANKIIARGSIPNITTSLVSTKLSSGT